MPGAAQFSDGINVATDLGNGFTDLGKSSPFFAWQRLKSV